MKAMNMTAPRIGSALLLLAAVPAFAHHSFTVFCDADRRITVRGVLQEFQFRNPHGLLKVPVKDAGAEAGPRDDSHYLRVRADGTPAGTAVHLAETVGEQE